MSCPLTPAEKLEKPLSKLTIQYFGAFRAAANMEKEEVVFTPNTTLFVLLAKLASKNGETFRGEVFAADGESLREDITVTVNGAIVKHKNVPKVYLQPEDVIQLFPVFPGGG